MKPSSPRPARSAAKKKVVKKSKAAKYPPTIPPAVLVHDAINWNGLIPNIDINKAEVNWNKRLLIFTPTTGLVRVEWVQARYSQIIPTNWSFVDMVSFMNPYVPVSYQLADAQNLMAKKVIEEGYEWVLFVEHDNVLPPDAFIRMNQYMQEGNIPMVSGLYFLRSTFTEPLIYRGRGSSHFRDWKLNDRVWVDGVPMGFLLVHASLIKAAWDESEEYQIGGQTTRHIFSQPNNTWFDPETGGIVAKGGTTDLQWCSRLMEQGLFEKAGWPEFQKMKYPFLVDTRIFVKHIDTDGVQWPLQIPARFIGGKDYQGIDITE